MLIAVPEEPTLHHLNMVGASIPFPDQPGSNSKSVGRDSQIV